MTAEIAILNRSAVTLAADSAMTLSGGAADKIYNSVDKIFELSRRDPIGIMIYNNLEFMRVPLELIIKRFRDSQYCIQFDTVADAAEAFFSYLESQISASEVDQSNHVFDLACLIFKKVRDRFEFLGEQAYLAHSKGKRKNKAPGPHQIFLKVVNLFIAVMEKRPILPVFSDVEDNNFEIKYTVAIENAIVQHYGDLPLDEDDKKLLRKLCIISLKADYFSDIRTGFVFSGYGGSQIFPSLIAFESDGLIAEKLKRKLVKRVEIDRASTPAAIVPFAQHEMVDRFLFGIDPQFEKAIGEVLNQNMTDIGNAMIENLPRVGRKTKEDLSRKLKEAVETALLDFQEKSTPSVKEDFWNQIRDTVLFMTKPDLSHFAESLVNITSIKRRVSLEQETVGGPIDVAVISRTEGFVWVKRKHYFEQILNPGYFYRKYGTLPQNLEGEKA